MLFSLIILEAAFLIAEDFSQENAYNHLKYIAGTIGPRPLGSPQEKAALKYFADKLAEYGARVEWQTVTGVKKAENESSPPALYAKSLNTNSFNVIGRFPGATSREIIIGAHIDSLSPEVPGADDDGSGVAAILEVARVLSKEPHNSTLIFVAFCGEELGLIGSQNFVEKYPLNNVALMLQLDMTSNNSPLTLWIDTKKQQSPEWLVRASINIFHDLGYHNIDYPTHFQSLNNSFEGAGSDHQPFLKKGIPAIAFVSDTRIPIHTRNDSLSYFKPDGLERSGRLVLELARKFDRNQPDRKTGKYILWMLNERPFFIGQFILIMVVLISIAISLITLIRAYRMRKEMVNWDEEKKIKLSWPKLLVIHLVIIVTIFASLWLTQLIKGERFPWYAYPGTQVAYAFVFLLPGIWLALQILNKLRLRKNTFFYFIRSSAYLIILILLLWIFVGPRQAFYPAVGLLLISLACLVRGGWLKGLLWLLSPYLMLRMLVLPEYFESVYRPIASMGFAEIKTFGLCILIVGIIIVFMMLWSMPFLLGFAAVYRSHSGDLFRLKRFRSPSALIPLGILIIGGAIYLYTLPSYTPLWEQQISATQKYDSDKNKTSVEFGSSDYLYGLTARINDKNEFFKKWTSIKEIDTAFKMNWLKEQVSTRTTVDGKEMMLDLKLQLKFEKQPYSISLILKSDKPYKIEKSNVNYGHRKKKTNIRWFSFPAKELNPEMKIRMPKNAKLDAEITAIFLETPLQVTCEGRNKFCISRSKIIREINLYK